MCKPTSKSLERKNVDTRVPHFAREFVSSLAASNQVSVSLRIENKLYETKSKSFQMLDFAVCG